ncbi:MAG: YihY/virulence factor BrkB family protein [Betaproteobacteria bacterium]|nr:YihY/virulence factor BrkB family protein [Betaproteobacteria bacterium]
MPAIAPIPFVTQEAKQIIKHPAAFALQVMRAFRANQGLLLAGAVAYYTLLSIVPLLILIVMGLSQVVDQVILFDTLRRALEWVAPGQSQAVVQELAAFLEHRTVMGWVLLGTMLVFSSLAFSVLESAISVIFLHRVKVHKRHFLVSLALPFGYIAFIALALFAGTFVMPNLLAIGRENLQVFGDSWSLSGLSRGTLYVIGVGVEILLISSIYYFMPVGRISARHALIGGATAGLLWEVIRHALVWYFTTLSQVSVVYGSLTTAIVVLLSFEIAATLLLVGAQVIAEYERVGLEHAVMPLAARQVAANENPLSAAAPPTKGRANAFRRRRKRKPAGPPQQ